MTEQLPNKDELLKAIKSYERALELEWASHAKTLNALKNYIGRLSVHEKVGAMIISESFPDKDRQLLGRENFSIVSKIEILYMITIKKAEEILTNRDYIIKDGGDPLREIGIVIDFAINIHNVIFSSTDQDSVFDEAVKSQKIRKMNNERKREKAAEDWRPWQDRYRELRAAGMKVTKARYTVADEREKRGLGGTDMKTLKNRLRDENG